MSGPLASRYDIDHISICICTYKRPELLAALLDALLSLETGGLFHYSLVIIDNDERGTAEPVISSFRNKSPFEAIYQIERVQNISLARNRAILNARGTHIAFIDDDEIPDRDWLLMLYRTLCRFQADAALGPVLPSYTEPPPRWVVKGRFYERPSYATGTRIGWTQGRTGNILIKRGLFLSESDLFDPKFGSGGEDQDFTRRMLKKGHVFVWCNEARAYEAVPPIRWKRSVMLKRALLRGKMSSQYPGSRPVMVLKGLAAISAYATALPILALSGQDLFMRYLVKICDHFGRILALLNIDVIKQKYITK